jgi:hypothetical protein
MKAGYWMYETGGELRPAVEAYLRDDSLTPKQIATLRAYLQRWIMLDVWRGEELAELRGRAARLTDLPSINAWLRRAADAGIDPL